MQTASSAACRGDTPVFLHQTAQPGKQVTIHEATSPHGTVLLPKLYYLSCAVGKFGHPNTPKTTCMAYRLTGVGHRDIIDLVGVQPHLPQSAVQYGRGKPLLQLQGHHDDRDQEPTLAASHNQARHDGQ